MKTLSARAAGAASASQLGDGDVRDGASGRRRDVRVVALGGGTGLPVLLVEGIAEAIATSRARVVLVMNLVSEPGETDGYGPADFVRAIVRHAPRIAIHDVLVNVTPIPDDLIRQFAAAAARPIAADREALIALGCRPIERDLLGAPPHIRHDPSKLARAVVDLALEALPR